MILPAEAERPPMSYRFKRGLMLADMPPVPPEAPVPPLSSFNGPFQLAEYLSLKVRHDPHDIKGLVEVPTDNAKAADKHVWIYEHLRRIPIDATPLVTQLLTQCNRETCPEMKAGEWQYLCVAHDGDGANRCCAIDYILHALDSTTALLSSSSYFPSRLQIPHASLAHFPSLFRRLSRIFSHSYFHHREAFATAEAETSLYARFVALCERYELVGANLLIIPQEGYEVLSQEEDLGDDHEAGDDDDEDVNWDDYTGADSGDHDNDNDGDEAPRGREKDDEGSLGRSHSLGRHPLPAPAPGAATFQSPGKGSWSPVQPANKGKPAPAQASESLSPPSTRAILDGKEGQTQAKPEAAEEAQPPTILPGKGRNTLSRGKAPRGANLWSAEDVAGEKEKDADTEGNDQAQAMARRLSVDSVVYVGKEEDPASPDSGDKPATGASEAASEAASSAESKAEPDVEPKPEVVHEAKVDPPTPVEVSTEPEPATPAAAPAPAPETAAAPAAAPPSEPLSIPTSTTSSKPRTPSPGKLSTPPKPPAAASPGKSSPAPAQASPKITSPPTKSTSLPEDAEPSATGPDLVVPVPVLAATAQRTPSPLAEPAAPAPPAASVADILTQASTESTAAPQTAPVSIPAAAAAGTGPGTGAEAEAETGTVADTKAGMETEPAPADTADVVAGVGASPKSELQARPGGGGVAVSPRAGVTAGAGTGAGAGSGGKRNSKKNKGKKGGTRSPASPGREE